MRSSKTGRLIVLISSTLAAVALAVPIASQAVTGRASLVAIKPHVTTGGAQHVIVSSALLTGVVNPNGLATSYYFQYGPTIAYGAQTPTASVGSGTTKVKVGQPVGGLQSGVVYHYRIVGVYAAGVVLGRDHTVLIPGVALKFEIPKIPPVTVGTPFVLSGTLTGLGSAHHAVTLQASPYPYLEPFTNIGVAGATDAFGRFAFRVAHLSTSTEFRVITGDPRPVYSPLITVHAAVRVTLRVRSSGRPGLVRLFGTVTPAAVGAQVDFQVEKAVRPGRSSEESETATRFVNQFVTVVKKATRTFSRFSLVVKVRHGGRYRAFVKLRRGPLVSGISAQTVYLRAAPGKAKRKG
jgi:hypothetical protein